MDKTELHGHNYHHDEDLGDVVDRLKDAKYRDRLREAREGLKSGEGDGRFTVEGHHYRLHSHEDGGYKIKRDAF